MQKLARLSAVLALTVSAAAWSFAAPASVPSVDPIVIRSGTIKVTVKGHIRTLNAGDSIPSGAVLTAGSDGAVLQQGGMVVSAPAGATFQTAAVNNGTLDIRALSGGSLTSRGYGSTTVIPAGSEANVSGGDVQTIKGSVSVTTQDGGAAHQLNAGQQLSQVNVQGSNTILGAGDNGTFTTILPPPASPLQQLTVAPVSPSSP